ncbi:MAG: helix-turn-helix domain-containing protein [Bacteroidales bacterium]|nr:helix-turn-helix domain-containing protein [Bacteroidales bacterium]
MNLILTTPEQLEAIINKCLSKYFSSQNQTPKSEPGGERYLHSIAELATFLGCSNTSAQKLKNSGVLRYKQFGRKIMFVASEVLEDIEKNRKINK